MSNAPLPKSFEQLVIEAQNENAYVRQEAIHRLGGQDDERVPELLVTATHDPSEDVRVWAVFGIGNRYYHHRADPARETPLYFERLMQLLEDESLRVRFYTLAALAFMKENRAVPRMQQLLDDPDPRLRQNIVSALGGIGDLSALEKLIHALKDPHPNVRWSAAWALGDMKNGGAVEALIEALRDNSRNIPEPMETAVPATVADIAQHDLIEIGHPAIGQLITALAQEDSQVRRKVAFILSYIAPGTAVPVLVLLLHDDDPNVKELAEKTLLELSYTYDIPTEKRH